MPLLSLASGVVPEVQRPSELLRLAADAGYRAAGPRLDLHPPTPAELERARRVADEAGVRVLDVEALRITSDPADAATAERLLDAAVVLGATNVLVVSSVEDPHRTAAELARLAGRVEGAGITLALEFMRFSAVRSLGAASEVVALVGRPDVGVLVDTLHLARSGEGPQQVRATTALLPYVQLCDAVANGPEQLDALYEEAVDHRLLPGAGDLPLAEVVAALPGRPLSLEVRSRTLRESFPPLERAVRVRRATEAILP